MVGLTASRLFSRRPMAAQAGGSTRSLLSSHRLQLRFQGFDRRAQLLHVFFRRLLRSGGARLVDGGGEWCDFLHAFFGLGLEVGGDFLGQRLHEIADGEGVIVGLAQIFRGHDLGEFALLLVNLLPDFRHGNGDFGEVAVAAAICGGAGF